jgi:hypothetical protein
MARKTASAESAIQFLVVYFSLVTALKPELIRAFSAR